MVTMAMAFNMVYFMYRQVTLHFDLYPLNNFSVSSLKRRLLKSLLDGVLMLLPLWGLRTGNLAVVVVASGILFLQLVRGFVTWWLPYFTHASDAWRIRYDEIFADTIQVLPKIRDNPRPNLEHCILHLLNLACFLLTIMYLISE